MSTRDDPPTRDSLLQGTLDLLVLRILALGPHHGHGVAVAIQARSGDTLLVDPRLPTEWNALEFALRFRGRPLRLRIDRSGVTVAPADWQVYQAHDHWEVTTT